MSRRVSSTAAALAVLAAATAAPVLADVLAAPASPMAAPTQAPAVDPKMTRTGLLTIESLGPRRDRLHIASAAMRRVIEVDVLRGSGSGPRPTLYLLDGVDGEPTSGWLTKGGAERFFADKPVDVVLTTGGTGSMYSDWQRHDAALGLNRWETFLTEELPPIVESLLKADGRRAIAGVSMGAQAAMMLAQRHPGHYLAVAGMSGCYSTADPLGHAVTTITVASRGGNVENLWGPPSSPEWAAHDSLLGADKLRGTAIYLSAASGAPTDADLAAVAAAPSVVDALRLAGGGAALEAGARACTERFAGRLAELGIPAEVEYSDAGMHTWPDFEAQLPRAWRVLAKALGVPES
ncbi:alpha/beta hydrolase [Nocardia amikacinitolerans]|uniref:alpha/beta hydrolase n=1 Tax=Nocardia amikacinitolerans TaxID=756689 RepID=UPI0020A56683|nr:alpha/beta hydrolase family protein [Nocardia amikacinitolerans]MCP2289731.1 S-formylglutathione hydrolase FrmB [Nocardia amikacinitolerans]